MEGKTLEKNLIDSDADGNITPSPMAIKFSEAAAEAITSKLGETPTFELMPYRHQGESLGFDWSNENGECVSYTFHVTGSIDLPMSRLDFIGVDVFVPDMTDALLLVRMVAERVNGKFRFYGDR